MQVKPKAERQLQGTNINKLEDVEWCDFSGCPKKYAKQL